MKTSQLLAAGALLTGYAQACTRVRVDQSRDQSNPNLKYTTVTLYDDNRPPTGIVDYKSDINLEHDGWPFRGSSGHYDLGLDYYQGVFAKNIGGKVSFPQLPGYAQGKTTKDLEQKAEFTYWNEAGIEHHIYCLWDNYNCGGYTCGI